MLRGLVRGSQAACLGGPSGGLIGGWLLSLTRLSSVHDGDEATE